MSETDQVVYRHRHTGGSTGCPGCAAGLPLNLAERTLITGRSLTQHDESTGRRFCVDCLADLPRDEYEALFHICGEQTAITEATPEPVPVAVVLDLTPQFRPAKPDQPDRFVSGFVRAWAADRDAALRAAAEHGCDPDWCTAHRWDGHHVPTCLPARQAMAHAGLPDVLAEMGYREPLPPERTTP